MVRTRLAESFPRERHFPKIRLYDTARSNFPARTASASLVVLLAAAVWLRHESKTKLSHHTVELFRDFDEPVWIFVLALTTAGSAA